MYPLHTHTYILTSRPPTANCRTAQLCNGFLYHPAGAICVGGCGAVNTGRQEEEEEGGGGGGGGFFLDAAHFPERGFHGIWVL